MTQNTPPAALPVKRDLKALKAKSQARASRRAQRIQDNAELGGRVAKRVKRKKLPSMKRVKKAAWEALSLYVRARDAAKNGGRCLICSTNPIELAYHMIPAGSGSAAKWDPLNIVGACRDCNCGEFNRRVKYAYIHIQLFGLEYMQALEAKSRTTVQYKRHDFLAMTEDWKKRLDAIGGEG